MGSGIDFMVCCKDGSEILVEISLSFLQIESGMLVLVLICDIIEWYLVQQVLCVVYDEFEQWVCECMVELEWVNLVLQVEVFECWQVESVLWVSEVKCWLIIDNMLVGMVYIDVNQIYVYYNQIFVIWFGLLGDEIDGYSVWKVFGEIIYVEIWDKIEVVLSGKVICYEYE